ncbi:MAG TPA: hypothetical protein VJU84_18940 [Pyrinomonadaceae bacterium]|nr:hypothetical protein [Pyrinomonadaceae bacterium]
MLNRTRVFGVLFLVLVTAVTAYPDQPRMTAARADLNKAKAQLQNAMRNKGGHRAKAIGLINSAISEINAGIRFDRRHHHPVLSPDQPNMQRALDHLRSAKSNLENASTDKGGHRNNALRFVNDAIGEVKKGIDAGE